MIELIRDFISAVFQSSSCISEKLEKKGVRVVGVGCAAIIGTLCSLNAGLLSMRASVVGATQKCAFRSMNSGGLVYFLASAHRISRT